MIRAAAGSHFDPSVVDAFMEIPTETLDRIRIEVG
jgi:response regulator RpfG family c-di-GMP phosphodiesterase